MKNAVLIVDILLTVCAVAVLILQPFESFSINIYAMVTLLFISSGLLVVYFFLSRNEAQNRQI